LAVKHLHDRPEPIEEARPVRDLPKWLCRAIERLMEKDPEARYQTPQELSQFLQRSLADSGPVGAASATLATKLDATKALQQLMTKEATQRHASRFLRWGALIVLPCIALATGFAMGGGERAPQISTLLQPQLEVPACETVDAQYLQAVRLNEPDGWLEVSRRFPPEASPLNAAYAAKASIQLARLYRSREQFAEAGEVLERLLADPQVAELYRAIGLYEQMLNERAQGRTAAEEQYKLQLREVYPALKNTPQKLRIFNSLIDDELRSSLNPDG
jgi:serine/threonine-protein kinase